MGFDKLLSIGVSKSGRFVSFSENRKVGFARVGKTDPIVKVGFAQVGKTDPIFQVGLPRVRKNRPEPTYFLVF